MLYKLIYYEPTHHFLEYLLKGPTGFQCICSRFDAAFEQFLKKCPSCQRAFGVL